MVLFDFFLFLKGDSGVWGLKKNFALLELLERLQNGATNQSGVAEEALKGMGEVRPPSTRTPTPRLCYCLPLVNQSSPSPTASSFVSLSPPVHHPL